MYKENETGLAFQYALTNPTIAIENCLRIRRKSFERTPLFYADGSSFESSGEAQSTRAVYMEG